MRQIESSRRLTVWERILRGYVWFTIAALAVYWFIRPFTPFWLDVTFIFISVVFVLVSFALKSDKKLDDAEVNSLNEPDSDASTSQQEQK